MTDWKEGTRKWAGRALGAGVSLLVAAMAVTAAFSVLLMILIRDVPSLSGVAADLVTPLAEPVCRAAQCDPGQIAAQVVSEVDSSLLGGTLSAADTVRLVVKLLPVIPILVILVSWRLTPKGRRRRRLMGWSAAWFGAALLAYAWLLKLAAGAALSPLSDQAESVGDTYVSALFGPTWLIGWLTLAAGAALLLAARSGSADSARPATE